MIPDFVMPDAPASERRVFGLLKSAPSTDSWTVLHSLGISSAWTGEFGEIDFVVVIPRLGIVCIEVKGGAVAHENGVWTTRRHGSSICEPLKRSPFRQAQEGMWKLRRAIESRFGPNSPESKCPLGWLVILPDVACPPVTPEFVRGEVIDQVDLTGNDLSERIKGAPSVRQLSTRQNLVPPAPETCKRILGFLRPNFERVEMISTSMWEIECKIAALTEQQYEVLDAIADNPSCLVKGPAGTGKTNIAIECARRLSLAGKRVLLACYNRALGDWLRGSVARFGPGIVAGHIHGLLRNRISRSSFAADLPAHDDADGEELYGRLYFELGALAIDELGERFDVVLIDETQDMEAYRLADVVNAWTDGVQSPRVILFGDFIRQALYGRSCSGYQEVSAAFGGMPVFSLGVNCRNTKRIAIQTDLICGFTGTKINERQPEGEPVELFFADDSATVERVKQIVGTLRGSGYRPQDIVILGPRRRENSVLADTCFIGGWRLRDPAAAAVNDLAYSTIHSFKGLERPVVIVIEAGTSNLSETDSLLYVAMSRARLRLFVICRQEARPAIEQRLAEGVTAFEGAA